MLLLLSRPDEARYRRRVNARTDLLVIVAHELELGALEELARTDEVAPSRRLEQIFVLLALLHGRDTMRSTASGVQSESPRQRGTALELLETVLPPALCRQVFSLIDGARSAP